MTFDFSRIIVGLDLGLNLGLDLVLDMGLDLGLYFKIGPGT